MDLSKTVDLARNFAVMVRVRGPDPKGMKMRRHAFHQYRSGETTLSASGMLVPDTLSDNQSTKLLYDDNYEGRVLVLTVASVVEPFLSPQHRDNIPQDRPELIPSVRIDIMTEKTNENSNQGTPSWLGAQLLSLVDIPASAVCLQSLIEASVGSPEHEWEVGWSLASNSNDNKPSKDLFRTQGRSEVGGSGSASLVYKSLTRMAILSVPLSLKDLLGSNVSSMNKRGDFLLAVGSPFGVLSPTHFFNSISVGRIANCYPPYSSDVSLLMADIRCLPGMEGSPVFSEDASLTGIMIRPLRQKTTGAEIQLVIPWDAVVGASSGLLQKSPQNGHLNFNSSSLLPSEKAMASICLVTIGDGVWASGVLLNSQGLILTNAHLLEPWRFGKTHLSRGGYGTNSAKLPFKLEGATDLGNGIASIQKSQTLPSKVGTVYSFTADTYDNYRNIRVRLDHVNPSVWCGARVVYICKGPWDVALLQLESVPKNLLPVEINFSRPSTGSKTYVIGHGLFGPKCGFFPSVCSGVVAKVVEAKTPQSYQSIQPELMHMHEFFPAMLETTAAVHPGASGGAVINSDGHMIGLVTSNARHGGGTIIPHLNFSIPSAALIPIFKFSKDMKNLSVLRILDEPNEYISSVWALMRPSSPKLNAMPNLPQSLVDNNKSKEVKGSQFAKFIAERNDIFKMPSNIGKSGVLTKEVVPSKL
ncbi:PREDICTED: glyoxysomal processing protease, glyoxysomal isoform X2 [Lupinus angustifolius]|uniref:glyoxysomal processing protease, glyoxysomal isoform X2 n=1 Tax=Lupinus angustifolius TaxID=3871 RepID=UPI00092EEC18|nr:PREDICTED: glyoxysomal processing protease, glyoxysomal isoform X2 [Lupinus angustifolius]